MSNLGSFMGDLGRMAGQSAVKAILSNYPGLTLESIKSGWLPVPQVVLQGLVSGRARAMDSRIEDVRITIEENRCHVEVDITAMWVVKNRLSCTVSIEEFALSKERDIAIFRCDDAIATEGRNLLGTLLAFLIAAAIESALKFSTKSSPEDSFDGSAVSVNWPLIQVHLRKISKIDALVSKGFGGLSLLDIIALGPARLRPGRLELQIRTVGILANTMSQR